MNRQKLWENIQSKKSYLCVGLDPDIKKIPRHLLYCEDPIFEFSKGIIDATRDYCVAYKPNVAFFEAMGPGGWTSLKKTVDYIEKKHFIIADAKRGDIGNTSELYARLFYDWLGTDCVTVAPYMGEDSVRPFLRENKWIALLVHTSNSGSADFQTLKMQSGKFLYEEVLDAAKRWGSPSDTMLVVGATHPERFESIRKLAPEHFFLVPGVGAQGGDLRVLSKAGFNSKAGLLVNSSRAIIYASSGKDFAEAAANEAAALQKEMEKLLVEAKLV